MIDNPWAKMPTKQLDLMLRVLSRKVFTQNSRTAKEIEAELISRAIKEDESS